MLPDTRHELWIMLFINEATPGMTWLNLQANANKLSTGALPDMKVCAGIYMYGSGV